MIPVGIYFVVLGSNLYTFLCFLSREWRAGLVVLNSLSFWLSVKLVISPSYLNEILAGYSNLGCRLFSFITLSMSCHSLLAWRVSVERSAIILIVPFWAAQATRSLAGAVSPGGWCALSPPPSQLLGFLGAQRELHLKCAVCFFWGADFCLRPFWWMSAIQDPRNTWLATGSLLTVW